MDGPNISVLGLSDAGRSLVTRHFGLTHGVRSGSAIHNSVYNNRVAF